MLSIGGAAASTISGGTWRDHSSGYSFYNMQLTSTTDSYFYTNLDGLIILGYATGSAESYYYLASSGMRTLDVAFYANDIHYQDLEASVCDVNEINFRASIQDALSTNPGRIKWYIDGVPQTAAQDQLTWSKTLPNGVYTVLMEVLLSDNTTVKYAEGTLVVGVPFDLEVCQGTSVTFTFNPHNQGSSPTYQWKVNGSSVPGANNITYTYVPSNGDVVVCELTSSEVCADPATITSHSVTVRVSPGLTPSVVISTPSTTKCSGETATFTATPTNGGSNPSYQWKVNGGNVGTNSSTFTYTPANGDAVTCVLTSSETVCISSPTATSDPIIMTISTVVPSATITATPNN